jgi:hypothetical protein
MRYLYTFMFAGIVVSQLGATQCGNILADPGFDLWCDNKLCAWKLERGSIARVPTWNQADPGVELVGNDVAIEQLTPVSSGDGSCIEFDMIANIELDATVDLNVDLLGDGTIEHVEHLPTSNWAPLSYQINIHGSFAGIRFELTKKGNGRAVIANIAAKDLGGRCSAVDAISAVSRPLGTPCDVATDCASGICGPGLIDPPFKDELAFFGVGICIACDSVHPCSGTDVCGLGIPTGPVRASPTMCVPDAAKQLGEQCAIDAECSTGVCTEQICSTCNAQMGCTAPETCGRVIGGSEPVAWECSPEQHLRLANEPCAIDEDCKSNHCNGQLRFECQDGRPCVGFSDDNQCPFNTVADNVLQSGFCMPVGMQGGSCQ